MITKKEYMVRCKYFNDSNSTCNGQEYGIGGITRVDWTSYLINKEHIEIIK